MSTPANKSLIQTYHLPPNFSIGPAPRGPIQLGSILTNLRDVEVLNSDCRIPIDEAKVFSHVQQGFQSTTSHMRRGELGIWAKAVGFEGLGGELSGSRETSTECKYKFRRLDAFYFSPSPVFRRASMNELDVAEYVEATGWAPVYLVTGLKVAVQPSVQMSTSKGFAALGEAGVSEVTGLPVNIGPRVDFQSQDQSAEGWTTSDDFIYGIRVEKLVFKRRWFSLQRRDEGPLQSKLKIRPCSDSSFQDTRTPSLTHCQESKPTAQPHYILIDTSATIPSERGSKQISVVAPLTQSSMPKRGNTDTSA